jgi:Protein of unknown function (DUF1612)/HTH DNA binding domain
VNKLGVLPLEALIAPVVKATEILVRLDERVARSPVQKGWMERQNFADAAAALWLEGELVHHEDLILHDAHMDIRTPTHELTRAHAILRARRQIFDRAPDWALSRDGFLTLIGRPGSSSSGGSVKGEGDLVREKDTGDPGEAEGSGLTGEDFAAIDMVLARSTSVLEGVRGATRNAVDPVYGRQLLGDRSSLVYDQDWDEEMRLAEWQNVLSETETLPAVLRASILLEAWASIEVLQHAAWLGPLLVAALLRQEGIAAHHLVSPHLGAKEIPRERRRARDRSERISAYIDAMHQMALSGLKEHDRLLLAKGQLERRLRQRRSSSKLPELIELVLARPIISTGMIQRTLKVSKQGAHNLISELGLRELTGRGRFRAWGIV